ncbi:uncharacterized Nudix hydrolase NudL-like isoform X5 [Argopecten irradians]|uniref:uncharacterized Nudix hydrolase NudL-like isoform X5 n=1 Tax=Argopecten irradians TaxID=31199 RepID=UPI00372267E9
MISESDLRARFRRFDIRLFTSPFKLLPELRKAGVLVPLFQRDGEWRVLLTKRASHLRVHSGEVAFPGGKQDDGDTDEVAAALREAEEEIGLNPEDVRIVAVFLPSYVTKNIVVTAVLGLIPSDFVPNINTEEVEKTFDLPLRRFLETDFTIYKIPFHGKIACVHSFADECNGDTFITFGYTAMYCMRVAVVAYQADTRMQFIEGIWTTKDDAFYARGNFLNVFLEDKRSSNL